MASSVATPRPDGSILGPTLGQRVYGLGSVYGKTLRESRRAAIAVAALVVVIFLAAGAAMKQAYPTALSRQELVSLAAATPEIFNGLVGKPINVGTLGGFVAWKYGVVFPLLTGLWSILALSSTLASEVGRGSMDFVAAGPQRRRRIAVEKLAGHVTALTVAMAVVALGVWLSGRTFETLPGDAIPVAAAVGYALWLGLTALAAGSVAWALAGFLGRGAAAGLAGAVMFAGYIFTGYRASVPVFSAPAQLSWFTWTAGHNPLAGQADWASLLPVALVAIAMCAIGVEVFSRRDLGARSVVRLPGLPAALAGIREPAGRSFGQLVPGALGWGIGLALFGLLIAASSRSFANELAKSPDLIAMIKGIFPTFDLTSPGGFLTLVFMAYGLVLAGFAAATFISGWASDETSGRLEMVLSTPVSRSGWVVRSGLGVVAAIIVVTTMTAIGIALGASSAGTGDVATPILGTFVLGFYACAMAGIGIAVAGVFGAARAAATVGAFVVLTLLVDFLAPPLHLPDWFHQLALSAHMGQPMVGTWDPAGIAACVVLAIGGIGIGAWGYGRRDIGR